MKKLLLTAFIVFFSIHSFAEGYDTLTFTKADGTEITLPAIGLKFTFDDGMIVITSGQSVQTIELANVNSMYFSNPSTSIYRSFLSSEYSVKVKNHQLFVTAPQATDITITSVSGVNVGRYVSNGNAEEAVGGWIPSGIYIVKTGEQTFKVVVR